MSNYIAIIGDLIDSRKIKNRIEFQENLKDIFITISKKYKNTIVSNFTLTLGDEFQAILNLDHNLFKIVDEIYIQIGHPFRLGIGYGEISTKIDSEMSIGADGEAFWKAREAINYVHGNNYQNRCHIHFIGKNQPFDDLVNSILLLTETIKSSWTQLQLETYSLMIKNNIFTDNFNQQEFAKSINISQSSLSKRLSTSNIKVYLKGRLELNNFMEYYYD